MNLLTAEQVAERIKLHVVNVRTLMKSGALGRVFKLGRCWRVREDDLEAALERFRVHPAPPRAARHNELLPRPETVALLRPRQRKAADE